MRDLLPPESRARRRVSEHLQGVFERFGYELVTTPLFEHVEVFERGLALDHRDLVRFVEPDSGEVAAMRPDITPQIARVVSTRLSEYPPPFRLRYEGTVIRRRRGRARRQRQIAQVGVELIGLAGPEADLEVVRLISKALEAAGLAEYRIELSEVGVGRALLSAIEDVAVRGRAAEALARKDEKLLRDLLVQANVPNEVVNSIAALAHWHGGIEVLRVAEAQLSGTAAAPHVQKLKQVAELLVQQGLADKLGVDLGETRGAAYYTGVSFAIFAPGPGEAVASGGRYDHLLERYGKAQPATGVGIDLENLLWALDYIGHDWRERDSLRFLVIGGSADTGAKAAEVLHTTGHIAATLTDTGSASALAYAKAWGYDVCIDLGSQPNRAIQPANGGNFQLGGELTASDIPALVQWARATQKE